MPARPRRGAAMLPRLLVWWWAAAVAALLPAAALGQGGQFDLTVVQYQHPVREKQVSPGRRDTEGERL